MVDNNKGLTRNMRHGMDSEFIQKLRERIGASSALSKVEKMQLEGLVSETIARGIALDADLFVNKLLMDKVKEFGSKVLDYEGDLSRSQSDLADIENNLQFYKAELRRLKEQVSVTEDNSERDNIFRRIYELEEQINKSQRLKNNIMKLRNDIRKEVDKKEFNEQKLKLEEESTRDQRAKKVMDIDSVDLEALEE